MGRLASVSPATVSLVVNGIASGRVSEKTQARVRHWVEVLNYRVDGVARGLSTGRRRMVALVAPDITNPFFSNVAMGVAEVLGDESQLLLVVAGPGQGLLLANVERVLALRVDAILVDSPSAALVRQLRPACPMILLDAPGAQTSGWRVDFDLDAGAGALADHLVSLGHRRIGYLDATSRSPTFRVRRSVIQSRLRAAGDSWALPVARSAVNLLAAADAFRRAWPRWSKAGVTAVACATDAQAYGVLQAARELGLRIPETISVTGFDDLEYSTAIQPPLTTVSLSGYELGMKAATLVRQIQERQVAAPHTEVIPTTLRVRSSTGRAASPKGAPVQAGS
ncbi:MAG: LacI family DNA-binding transcriptional regulator [Chloroflexota bacterium]